MASEKQLEANRQNAQLGGVKTEEGKAIIRFNALKHGLLSKEVLLGDESKQELDELAEWLKKDIKPQNMLEMFLVDKIITDIWRLKRAIKIEKEMLENAIKTAEKDYFDKEKGLAGSISNDLANDDTYGKFTRYITTIERGIYKALHELQRLQAGRNGQIVPLPIALDIDEFNKE